MEFCISTIYTCWSSITHNWRFFFGGGGGCKAKRKMKVIKERCIELALRRTRETKISREFTEIDCSDLTRQQPTTVTNAFVLAVRFRSSWYVFISNQIGCATLFHNLYFRNCSVSFLMADGLFFSFQVCDAITIRFIFKGNLTGQLAFWTFNCFVP